MDQPRQDHNSSDVQDTDIDLSVSSVTHPDGTPADLLDLDLGIVIRGKVTVPNQMTGTGRIDVYAEERGGSFNQSIGSDVLAFPQSTTESGTTDYAWSVVIPPGSELFSDSDPGYSRVFNVTVVFIYDQNTELVKFIDMGAYMIN